MTTGELPLATRNQAWWSVTAIRRLGSRNGKQDKCTKSRRKITMTSQRNTRFNKNRIFPWRRRRSVVSFTHRKIPSHAHRGGKLTRSSLKSRCVLLVCFSKACLGRRRSRFSRTLTIRYRCKTVVLNKVDDGVGRRWNVWTFFSFEII